MGDKDEAISKLVMNAAKKHMQNKDFTSARKLVNKAQKLFADEICKMLMICEVHCAAEKKLHGSETNWYDILQIEPTADETAIKKQYAKLARQLNPDKNQLPGAESAFKLIGQAQRVLLDGQKCRSGNYNAADSKGDIFQKTILTSETGSERSNGKRKRKGSECFRKLARHDRDLNDEEEEEDVDGMTDEEPEKKKLLGLASGMNGVMKIVKCSKEVASCEVKESEDLNGRKSLKARNAFKIDSSSKTAANEDVSVECRASEFNDFYADRQEKCFAVNQIWALYDSVEAMPRFYAQIKEVFSPQFKVRITWLEPAPDDQNEIEWANEGLPIGCGKFKFGDSEEELEDTKFFSHSMSWVRGSREDTCCILPRKEEVWALFKNWNMSWKSETRHPDHKYQYEFVKILSDYIEGTGITVSYLSKVEGYVSLFRTKASSVFLIPPSQLFRFSHGIPSFVLTGKEIEGVPNGSFELDPQSLPSNIVDSEEVVVKDHSDSEDDVDIPDPVFFNFDECKSNEKFETGQIWSLYCEEDGLPKYYGIITKVVSEPTCLTLNLKWLYSPLLPNRMTRWQDKGIPITCGRFNVSRGKIETFSSSSTFSHLVRAESLSKVKQQYLIFPREGEIWALYRHWTVELSKEELLYCEYDIVRVIEKQELHFTVSLLERVDSFKTVFKPQDEELSVFYIPVAEVLKFSHQIPCFQLSEEQEGRLNGFWELDPDAMPPHYFN